MKTQLLGKNPTVFSENIIVLVGGANLPQGQLLKALTYGGDIVAADGGADSLLQEGESPVLVIGDMDSISHQAQVAFADRVHLISEQETTDFDKALRHIDAPLVLALGVSGGRLDHELAALNCLVRHHDRPCLVFGEETITCLLPCEIVLPLPVGTDLSIFPMGSTEVCSQGLEWPTEGLRFSPATQIGTSNRVSETPVRLTTSAPRTLLILPVEALDVLVQALLEAPRWN